MTLWSADKIEISFDDESKELIRQLVKAVDRIADSQAPQADVSFGDAPKRLIEQPRSLPQPHPYYYQAWQPTYTTGQARVDESRNDGYDGYDDPEDV